MSVIYLKGEKSKGPEDWERIHPKKHWVQGRSARALAFSWEKDPQGFPDRIQNVFNNSGLKLFEKIKPSLIIPEHAVRLPGRGKASMNDLFVIADANDSLVSMMVEGKVDEGFDEYVYEWSNGTANRERRLRGLCKILDLQRDKVSEIRYQLLHRTASAIIEAKRHRSTVAVMIVHSFDTNEPQSGFIDYTRFVSLYNEKAQENRIIQIQLGQVQLFLAWIKGDPRFLTL